MYYLLINTSTFEIISMKLNKEELEEILKIGIYKLLN